MAYCSKLEDDYAVTRILTVVERAPDVHWKLAPTEQNGHAVLCLALEGAAQYSFYGEAPSTVRVARGDSMFFTDTHIRSAKSDPDAPWRFISVTFDLIAYGEKGIAPLEKLPFLFHNTPQPVQTAFETLNSVWTGKNPAYMLRCRSLLEEILYELIRLNGAAQSGCAHYEKIETIRQFMQDHYDQPFSVEALAEMAHCSPSHFRMLFRSVVGMTATQYLTMVRINKAKDFLLSGEMNVSEAALRTGFRDIFYFSRQFKAVTGHAPSHYAK